MNEREIYLKVINELLLSLENNPDSAVLSKVYFTTITLMGNLYGQNDIRISNLAEFKTKEFDPNPWPDNKRGSFRQYLKGVLTGIKTDIENDLIFNLEKQTIGRVVADFITLAKQAAQEDIKEVAAVLASAALEDSLKRYAGLNGLQVDDKDMSEVINALKSAGLLKGPQASVVTSYIQTRNKAFHAEFNKIEMPEVKSLIAFTEEFIIKNLS